uniref:Gfo/Idh/MocA-like oxidoreductase N-terminal domain-containing protein n=1 Tax=Panagrolaimus sp. ES5 TaxID=591445 RepID=A0AC34FD01_9BILA
MSKILNWGIIGCGKISHDFIKATKKCINPNKIYALAANIVYIGVQHELHKKVVLQALDIGKNVLCEKPIGVNAKEAKEMYEKAKERNLFLMEATWSRCFPAYQEIRKIIKKGTLGKVLGRDKLDGVNQGRSPINETGIYTVQFALWVIDEIPSDIFAAGDKNENGVDKWAQIILKFPSGSKATLFYSGIDVSPNNAYISFEKGMIEIPGYFWCPNEIIVHKGFVNDKNPPSRPIKFPFKDDDLNYNYSHSTGLRYEADHVYDCLSSGKKFSNLHSPEDSLKVFDILDEVREQLGVVYPQDN